MSSPEAQIAYLRSLPAVRERCSQVHALGVEGKLPYFELDLSKEPDVVDFCAGLMIRDFPSSTSSSLPDVSAIPPHSRWRHFDVDTVPRVQALLDSFGPSTTPTERAKRLLDLFVVSVLLDAGAGASWAYTEPGTGKKYGRSEGLAVASLEMFKGGLFSGVEGQPFQVDASGLAKLTPKAVEEGLQVSESNPMTGIEGRTQLLINLSAALRASPEYFCTGDNARPGNLIDYLSSHPSSSLPRVQLSTLWHALLTGLNPIWPASRTALHGESLGDVWPCSALGKEGAEGLVPFHKLSQWMTYSLLEPLQKILGWEIEGVQDMTGLPEYRNGGLLLDFGVLKIKREALGPSAYPSSGSDIPELEPSHPAVVEWRALTVISLDRIAAGIRKKFGLSDAELALAQVLESATWKGGREIARKRREGGVPPISIISDGTVF